MLEVPVPGSQVNVTLITGEGVLVQIEGVVEEVLDPEGPVPRRIVVLEDIETPMGTMRRPLFIPEYDWTNGTGTITAPKEQGGYL